MMNDLSQLSGETLPKGANDQVKRCAKAIIENGFKPGILMIDDGWQEDGSNRSLRR